MTTPIGGLLIGSALLGVRSAAAQPRPFFHPEATNAAVVVRHDVPYGRVGDTVLAMDVYQPPTAPTAAPGLVIVSQGDQAVRRMSDRVGWATVAATRGMVVVVPDLRAGRVADDWRLLMGHLTKRGRDYGLDVQALGAIAWSGNVATALPLVEEPNQTTIKAAVMLYGTGAVTQFRPDLPIRFVRAGLDRPALNTALTELVSLALNQNAPVSIDNYPGGHHAFETVDPGPATRVAIDGILSFLEAALAPDLRMAIAARVDQAQAAGMMATGRYSAAVAVYARLAAANAGDAALGLSYGEALLADRQFAEACRQLATLKNRGLGPRDLGLPAARACVQAGDLDGAIEWLASIPRRFLPPSVATEAVFAPLRDRATFRALFDDR